MPRDGNREQEGQWTSQHLQARKAGERVVGGAGTLYLPLSEALKTLLTTADAYQSQVV